MKHYPKQETDPKETECLLSFSERRECMNFSKSVNEDKMATILARISQDSGAPLANIFLHL